MKQIYLIRHGETDWNNKGIAMGNQDIPLNELGRKQAALTAQRLASLVPNKIYSSDLTRAAETAQIIAKEHNLEPIYDQRLREINLGGFEVMPSSEMRSQYPHSYKIIGDEESENFMRPYPNSETRLDLLKRSAERFDSIWNERESALIFIVCHGGVIRCMQNHIIHLRSNIPEKIFYSQAIDCDNCSITIIEADSERNPALRILNDTTHLTEL